MSMTLDALWSIHGLAEQADVSQSTEFVARRGGRGFKFSFFYGPLWLFLFAGLGGWYYQYRKKNPDKAKKFEQRLRGASASARDRMKTAIDQKTGPGATPTQYGGRQAANHRSAYNAEAQGARANGTKRFNPPPNWPTPRPDWTPDADWRPDPSWPPAPAGWQFWVA